MLNPWILIFFIFIITYIFTTIVVYYIFHQTKFMSKRVNKIINKKIKEMNKTLLDDIPKSQIPDIPPIRIPNNLKISKQKRTKLEFDISSLSGSVINSIIYQRAINTLNNALKTNEDLIGKHHIGDSKMLELKERNQYLQNQISINKERLKKNLNHAKEEIDSLNHNGIDVEWYEKYFNIREES